MSVQYAIVAESAPSGGPIRSLVLMLSIAAQASTPAVPTVSIEDEVLGNIRAQTIGPATVADLALPEDFLRRVADRIVRSSYEERFRIVVDEKHTVAPPSREADERKEAPISTWQVLLWTCVAGFVAVFGGLVWKGRRTSA